MITEEDYVSFEVAKLLKEKGFKGFTMFSYSNKGTTMCGHWENEIDWLPKCTHQAAMRWFREHKIYIMIDRSWSVEDSWHYCICVNDDFDHLIKQDSIPNRAYEEAVEAALKYSLENLI